MKDELSGIIMEEFASMRQKFIAIKQIIMMEIKKVKDTKSLS